MPQILLARTSANRSDSVVDPCLEAFRPRRRCAGQKLRCSSPSSKRYQKRKSEIIPNTNRNSLYFQLRHSHPGARETCFFNQCVRRRVLMTFSYIPTPQPRNGHVVGSLGPSFQRSGLHFSGSGYKLSLRCTSCIEYARNSPLEIWIKFINY